LENNPSPYPSQGGGFLFGKETKGFHSFLFAAKEEKKQKRNQKTSWLRGRLWDFLNTSQNSLRSDIVQFLCLGNPTSSKDLFVRNVFMTSTSTITLTGTSCGMFLFFLFKQSVIPKTSERSEL